MKAKPIDYSKLPVERWEFRDLVDVLGREYVRNLLNIEANHLRQLIFRGTKKAQYLDPLHAVINRIGAKQAGRLLNARYIIQSSKKKGA